MWSKKSPTDWITLKKCILSQILQQENSGGGVGWVWWPMSNLCQAITAVPPVKKGFLYLLLILCVKKEIANLLFPLFIKIWDLNT